MWNNSVNFQRTTSLAEGDFIQRFTLPFYYRDSYSEDRDEGIVVNVRF
jgi:hypothetical protein